MTALADAETRPAVTEKTRWADDPMGIAQLIVENPPQCPPWCVRHGLTSIGDDDAAWLIHWTHLGQVEADQYATVEIRRNQFVLDGGVDHEIRLVIDGETIVDALNAGEAERIGRALIHAATLARG